MIKRLFWDIETSLNVVLAFRIGETVLGHDTILEERKVITIAYKWEGEKRVHYLTWDENQDDRKMLAAFMEVANEADELVAHYGDRFDMPWFRTRCLIHGLPPLPTYKTIDTKAWCSKHFYFNSNKLDYVGSVLGLGRKIKTDFQLWTDIQIKKCPAAMWKMVKYNIQDVELLEKVYQRLAPMVKPKTHVGVLNGLDKMTCPRCGSSRVIKSKTRVTASGQIQHQMKCLDDGSYFTVSDTTYKSYTMKKKCKGGKKGCK